MSNRYSKKGIEIASKYTKSCSTPLVIRAVYIRSTIRNCFTAAEMAAIKKTQKTLYKNIHSSIIHNSHNAETREISISWWIYNQIGYIHKVEYYLAIKRNGVLIHVTKWTNLESVLLSERSQLTKGHLAYGFLYLKSQNEQIHRDKKWISCCQGLGERRVRIDY